MKSIKNDGIRTIEELLKMILGNEQIVHSFEVVPFDYRVENYSTPKLYISPTKLLFAYDEIIEIYELNELETGILGGAPRFTLWQQYLEGSYLYTRAKEEDLEKVKTSEYILKFSFNELNKVPKYFILRESSIIQKNLKTWAMSQLIMNVKNGMKKDLNLEEILKGNFSTFNTKTMLSFIFIFLVYFLLRVIFQGLEIDILSAILDIIFVFILLFMAWWTYSSITRNLDRFKNTFMTYRESISSDNRI